MNFTDLVGTAGVSILLLAYFLTLFHFLKENSMIYIVLNIIGAGIACYASCLLHYIPFIILEAMWMIVSAVALLRRKTESREVR